MIPPKAKFFWRIPIVRARDRLKLNFVLLPRGLPVKIGDFRIYLNSGHKEIDCTREVVILESVVGTKSPLSKELTGIGFEIF